MAKSAQVEVKRGRGRPASFPGVATVPFLAKLPETTRNMIRDFAARPGKEMNINEAANALILRGYRESTRK